jgi:hypothetical protein
VLVVGHDGFIADGTQQGLFQHQTRLLSRYGWLVNGTAPSPAGLSPLDQHTWVGYYAVPVDAAATRRNEAPGTLELRLSRVVGDGVHEDVVVTNHHHRSTTAHLALHLDGDFADVAEVDSGTPRTYGRVRRAGAISSDIGIALSTGVVDAERVPGVVERLFADDLFSGWGIRTLSSNHPAYDSFSYQRGSVWPVEDGAIALALARYGFHDALARLARAQFEAAALYERFRLPELFAGHPRDDESSVAESVLLVGVIVGSAALDWVGAHVRRLQTLPHPRPLLLVENGQLHRDNMSRERITDLSQMRQPYMEGTGHISVLKHDGDGVSLAPRKQAAAD